jgi:hypothetical protein
MNEGFSRAMDFAVETARELGAKVLHLEVSRENPPSICTAGSASKTTAATCCRSGFPKIRN